MKSQKSFRVFFKLLSQPGQSLETAQTVNGKHKAEVCHLIMAVEDVKLVVLLLNQQDALQSHYHHL